MSCYIMDAVTISELADFLRHMMDRDNGNGYVMSIPDELYRAFNDCGKLYFHNTQLIYKKLSIMNRQAYASVYPKETIDILAFEEYWEYPPIYHLFEWRKAEHFSSSHYKIEAWMYDVLKKLESYIYQCDEYCNRDSLILQGLKKFADEWMRFIIHNSEEYVHKG